MQRASSFSPISIAPTLPLNNEPWTGNLIQRACAIVEQLIDRKCSRDQLLPEAVVDDDLQGCAVGFNSETPRVGNAAIGGRRHHAPALAQHAVNLIHEIGAGL